MGQVLVKETTVVIGAGSQVGRLLMQAWADRSDLRWVSRNGARRWSCAQGAAALAPHLAGARDVLCLAAAIPGVDADLSLNQKIAQAVLHASSGQIERVFLASSAAVYGDAAGPHTESETARPTSDYGHAKLTMEHDALRLGQALGVQVVCLRIGNVVGADMLSRNIAKAQDMVVDQFADGLTPRRSFLDPVRFAMILDALIAIGRAGGDLPDTLNLASAPALAMADLLHAADVPFQTRPAVAGARPKVALDLQRLFALIPKAATPVTAAQAIAAWRACEVGQ